MIEIRITKEIGNFEPKFLGPFTMRQIVCLGIGLPICYFIYQTTAPYLPSDFAGFLCAIPAGIAALFGWCKPYGMKTEKFIKSIAVNILMAPTHRRYKTKNTHETMLRMMEEQEKESAEIAEPGKIKRQAKRAKEKLTNQQTPEYYL